MVARSRNATGPFETLQQATGGPNSVLLAAHGHWFAPGHNSVIEDDAGELWILYHAVDSRRPRSQAADDVNTRRVMLLDRLRWRDGWPNVAGGPSAGPRPAPIVRRPGR
jgi:arabinan endo-1,5-alpha-L-arabinosidase